THICPSCGLVEDRDVNAAKNIVQAGAPPSGTGAGGRPGELRSPPLYPGGVVTSNPYRRNVSAPPPPIPPPNTPKTPFRASTPTPQNTTRNTTFGSLRASCHETILLEDRASSTDGCDRPRQGKDHGKRTQPTNGSG